MGGKARDCSLNSIAQNLWIRICCTRSITVSSKSCWTTVREEQRDGLSVVHLERKKVNRIRGCREQLRTLRIDSASKGLTSILSNLPFASWMLHLCEMVFVT
jgi:hypothetical protein